jgi:tetratricopeptide (TPR) repeat protein
MTPSEALSSLLEGLRAAPGDPNAWHVRVVELALALGAFDQAALETLGPHPVPDSARSSLANALDREARGQLQVIRRTLQRESETPSVLTGPAIFADDPAAARALHALALDAVWAREAIDRLSRVATLVNVGAFEMPREVDDHLRESLPRWAGLRGMMLRLTLDMPEHRRSSWWLTLPAAPPELQDEGGDEADPGTDALEPMVRWLEARATPEGRLRLSKEEARTLLASERGQSLALELEDRLDLSALELSEAEFARLASPTTDVARSRGWQIDWVTPVTEVLWPELGFPQRPTEGGARPLHVALAASAPRARGTVPVAVALTGGGARVLMLTIELAAQPGDAFARAAVLGSDARAAIVAAFVVAVAHTRLRVPPATLEFHRVSVTGALEDLRVVDGASLGAAAAAAFLSLWANRTASSGVLSAEIMTLDESGKLLPVEEVDAKAGAVAALGEKLWVASAQATVGASNVERADSLRDALLATGILREGEREGIEVAVDAQRWTVLKLQQEIERGVQDVNFQELAPSEAWDTLAARLVVLTRALEKSTPAAREIVHGRVAAALAFLHAARLEEARSLLAGLQGQLSDHPDLSAYLEVVNSAALTDDLVPWDDHVTAAVGRLESIVSDTNRAVPRSVAARTRCLALGTMGRLHLHRARDDKDREHARMLLTQSIEEWRRLGFPQELPRSQTYLANCLRLSGRARDAIAVLEDALAGLEQVKAFSLAYEQSTAVFVTYELSRALLAAGEVDAAIEVGRRTLDAARGRRGLEVWPGIGVARSLLAALSVRGGQADHAESDQLAAGLAAAGKGETHPVVKAVCTDAAKRQDTTVY